MNSSVFAFLQKEKLPCGVTLREGIHVFMGLAVCGLLVA